MKKLFLLLVFFHVSFNIHSQNFWEPTNGPASQSILSIAINDSGYIYAGTSGNGVFRTIDNGNTWTQLNNDFSSSYVYSIAINDSGYIFAGTNNQGIFKSTNNGENWTQINNGLINLYIKTFVIDSAGHIYVGTGSGLYRSVNYGEEWIQLSIDLSFCYIQSLAIDAIGRLYAGTNVFFFRSTDNGETWNQLNSLVNDVRYLAINSNNYIFAGLKHNGIVRSINNGNSFNYVNNGIGYIDINCLAINSNGYIFAGTDSNGVFRSTDNGNNWTQINSGLATSSVSSLGINSSGFIFAGTNNGYGVFRSVGTTTDVNKDEAHTPYNYSLLQNYPNPFNPSTTINYSVAQQSNVSIIVYDVLGREVAKLLDEEKPIGNYSIEFNASDLSSGIYFYSLQSLEYQVTKKMIIMK